MTSSTPPQPDLSCTLAGLPMPNPVMTAAGCAAARELSPFLDLPDLGAFVSSSVTLDPRAGSAGPRLLEAPAGVLHDIGMQNPGLQGFLAGELPWLAQRGARTVVSVAGHSLGEYAELARRVGDSPGVWAVEVNLDCESRDVTSRSFAEDPYHAGKVLGVVRLGVPRGVPVLAKLRWHPGLVDAARAVVEAGADGVVVSGQVPGAALDRDKLGACFGTLSGPAVHALAVHAVWQVHAALPEVPVVGVGGVRSGWDALELLLAGASAVQVATATLHDPAAPARVVQDLFVELAARGTNGIGEVVGLAHRQGETT
jgi:dihydroorotate dehydrogenase (NAD+) catalytic subunit